MNKFNKILVLAVLTTLVSARTSCNSPSYYNSVNKKTGYSLKSELSRIISSTHKNNSYDSLYRAYEMGDSDTTFDNDGTVLDIYSEDPNGADPYNYTHFRKKCGNYKTESNCYNREHLFPQSLFYKRSPMRSDYFHVVPTDGKVNGMRGSYPFGEVSEVTWKSRNGSKLGKSKDPKFRGMVFEPIDEFKGDVARALLYFATRYERQITRFKEHAMTNGSSQQVYTKWFLKTLVRWHQMDPVSDHERQRNEAGCRFQKNRNPYIDNPRWVMDVWEDAIL